MVRGSGTVSTKLSKVDFEQKTSSVAWSSIFGTVDARAAAAWSAQNEYKNHAYDKGGFTATQPTQSGSFAAALMAISEP